jgi:hypothetical protein
VLWYDCAESNNFFFAFFRECKTLTGDVIHVTASGSMSVKELKERIAEALQHLKNIETHFDSGINEKNS